METKDREKILEKKVMIGGESFDLFLDRQRGASLYVNADRSRYLRVGDPDVVEKELDFHKQLLGGGFPVSRILDEGRLGERSYWSEESLGNDHLHDIFKQETESAGLISESSFRAFLKVVQQFNAAQASTANTLPIDFERLSAAVGFDGMIHELPDLSDDLRASWKMVQERLKDYPSCLTHGDFNPHNLFSKGVIDFGDHFVGPIGYDAVTAVTTPFWFPKGEGFEFRRKYTFTEDQVRQFFDACGTYQVGEREIDIRDRFDELFLLKAAWWSVRNQRNPKLQEWRYDRFRKVVDEFIRGESLLEHWQSHLND